MTDIVERLKRFAAEPCAVAARDWMEAALETVPIERMRNARKQIAIGEGAYGAQAHEYKQIARRALASHEQDTKSIVSQNQPKTQHKTSFPSEE